MSSLGLIGRRKPKNIKIDETPTSKAAEKVVSERILKEISNLDPASNYIIAYDPEKNPLKLTYTANIKHGLWAGGKYEFRFVFTTSYPQHGPVITCVSQVWHPNIDMNGRPCVNVLRTDWSSSYGIELLFNAINYLFLEPNPHDGLNHEASYEMISNPNLFYQHVLTAFTGGVIETWDTTLDEALLYTFHKLEHQDEDLVGKHPRYQDIDIERLHDNYKLLHQVGHEEYIKQRLWEKLR